MLDKARLNYSMHIFSFEETIDSCVHVEKEFVTFVGMDVDMTNFMKKINEQVNLNVLFCQT